MDLPDDPEDLDLTLRHVSRQFPEQLARALLPPGTVITAARWADTQITARQRRLDRALEVVANGERRMEHTELQLEMEADVPFRIYEYNTLMALALVAETPPGAQVPRVRSTLVLLSGREKPWPAEGEYRTSPDDASFSGVTFRIDPVYQRTVAELAARGSPLWMIFAPLAVDADPARMKEVIDKLRAEASRREFGELAAALTVVAGKDKRRRDLRGAILALLAEEDVMESSVFKMGEQRGIQMGEQRADQKRLVRLYERRLGRSLGAAELDAIVTKSGTLGTDRLFDVRDELSADALTAWLADPDAK